MCIQAHKTGALCVFAKTNTMDLPGNAALREFLDKISSSTNVGKWVELPMIAVMGDTSSGKSALLSALSMVELPSSHQLTTRCPVRLQMTQAEQVSATVDVVWRKEEKQGGYQSFDTVSLDNSWEGLPDAISRAQQFILDQTGKDVASDIVRVQVCGPDCIDLTLMDLPGIVRSRGTNESETLVEDIATLMDEYLKNRRCVILAVLPANVDFHNSQIMSEAQRVDQDTQRTIPVITKPDLIDEGAEGDVLDLLVGNKIPCALGFHMIKARGQSSLDKNQSIAESLQEEAAFFDSHEPWSTVEDRTMFGTPTLRQKLGKLQMDMVRATIPGILKEIREKQQHAFDTLVSMGNLYQTASDKRRYYQDYCQSFIDNLEGSLSGKGRSGKRVASAAAKLHDGCSAFMDNVREGSLGTIKKIVEGAQVLVTSAKGDVRGEVVFLHQDFANVDFVDEKDRTTDVLFDYVGYQAQERLDKDDVWSDGEKVYVAREHNSFDLLKNIPFHRIRTDPSWLKEKIAEGRTDDLACFLNVDMFKSIVGDFIEEDWKPQCRMLVDQTSDICMAAVSESLDKIADRGRFPQLRVLVRKHSERAAQDLLREAKKQVETHLEVEKHPYTQDQELVENIASARHRGLKRELEAALRLDQEEGGVYDTTAIKTIVDGVFERNRLKSVEDHMAEDMELVLESYGKIATKRVIDQTPQICWGVFRSLGRAIQDTLWNMTDDQLQDAMQDNDDFVKQYKDLTEELEEMNKALTIFQSLL